MAGTALVSRTLDAFAMTDLYDHYRWLVGPEGAEWLCRAAEGAGSLLGQLQRLRKEIGAERARLVVQQIELRRRAEGKFPHCEHLFFTRQGLEQATDHWVAAYKARRFGAGPVADLCAGIGGDLLALARRGPVVGVEIDRARALLAAANLRHAGQGVSSPGRVAESFHPAAAWLVVIGDACRFHVADFQAWHIDPDRRPAGRRTVRAELSQPDFAAIEMLRAACADAAIKLAPACPVPPSWRREAELEWIGRDGQCRQLVAWFGRLAEHPGKHRATLVERTLLDTGAVRTVFGKADGTLAVTPRLGRYLFEPDATVLAAGLTATLAGEHGLAALAPGSPYLTADHPVIDPALTCFEVCEVLPLDPRRLRRALRGRGIGRLEIKKRGLPGDPEALRRRLSLCGSDEAVLILARRGPSAVAILARRLGNPATRQPTTR